MEKIVQSLLSDIRRRGDVAVRGALKKYDGVDMPPSRWIISRADRRAALERLPAKTRAILTECADRIRAFHREERRRAPASWTVRRDGVTLGQRVSPVDSVGAYVPGGRFAYPSTVLMTCIPARLAGVRRVVVCTPPRHLTDEVLAAAELAGVDDLYRVGGVAAIGALAYGTSTIHPVDMIVGPGGAWVTEAKRQVFGQVGIDMLAGPSEIVIIADAVADPESLASDMMAQAEHDPLARATLISVDAKVLNRTQNAVGPTFRGQCRFVKVKNWPAAASESNRLAPEHLEVVVAAPQQLLPLLKNAGALFVGGATPVAVGDYWAGPSHVLPTGKSARFASGLSVQTFLKRTSHIALSSTALGRAGSVVASFAESEGLVQHARSARIRGKS